MRQGRRFLGLQGRPRQGRERRAARSRRAECSEVNSSIKESQGSRSECDVIPRFSIPARGPALCRIGAQERSFEADWRANSKISVIFVRIFKLNYDVIQFIERKERSDFRSAQRAVDCLESGGTRRGGGRRNRPHQYRRINPHGNHLEAGREVQYDRRSGRRHERRGSGEPDRQDDGALRGQIRFHAPLDRHVAQRPQGTHL